MNYKIDYISDLYLDKSENYKDALNLGASPSLYYKLAKAYYKTGELHEAIKAIEKAIEWRKEAKFYLLASQIYLKLNDLNSAYDYANKAFELEDSQASRINLASILFELEKYDEVISLLKPLAKNNNLDALRLLGRALEAEERYKDAVKIYERVVDIDKKDKGSWMSMGRCHLALKNYEDAVKAFERAYLIDPKDKTVCTSLAFAYESAGDLNKALSYVEKALELDPEDAHIWSSKGLLLLKLNKPREALKAFDKALELNPDLTSAQEGKMDCERIIEELELEKYARKILLHEYRTGKKITKKDFFLVV